MTWRAKRPALWRRRFRDLAVIRNKKRKPDESDLRSQFSFCHFAVYQISRRIETKNGVGVGPIRSAERRRDQVTRPQLFPTAILSSAERGARASFTASSLAQK